MSGWVKIHRSMWEKGWSNKPDYVSLWIHILHQATHTNREYFWNGKTIILSPGQFVTGRLKMAANTGIHESKVERILKCFENEQQIEQRKTSTSRLITILNWKVYQQDEQPFEQQMNNKRTTSEQPVNTKQELKELKNNNIHTRASKFVDYVNDFFGGRKFQLNKTVIQKFNARIVSGQYDTETLLRVVQNVKNSEYHKRTDYRYATPEFFLREETIEKYKHVTIERTLIDPDLDPEQIKFNIPQTEDIRDAYYGT